MANNKSIYNSLPKTVCDVSHLIDIQPGTSQNIDDTIYDFIPKKDLSEDFKYKVYSLYETIKKNSTRNKKKCLNAKQKKALFNLKDEKFNYETFHQINELWHSYFDSILDEVKNNADALKLGRIDLHGAYLLVIRSINTSIIGTKGYVLQESKNTFRILNNKNKLLTIPKNGTIFAFEHNDKLYRINGYNIMMSSYNRSKVKPKYHLIPDL